MDEFSLTEEDFYELTADSAMTFYGVEFSDSSNNLYLLSLYPDGDSFKSSVLLKEVDYTDSLKITAYDYSTFNVIGSRTFGEGTAIENCDDSSTFGGCMDCALDRFDSDWLSRVYCIINGPFCVAAAALHCA